MQDRALQQIPLVPSDNGGGRITIANLSRVMTTALTPNQTYHFWATKVCWVRIGATGVVAVEAANADGAGVVNEGSFPISAGVVYEIEVTGASDGFLAVVEDSNYTDAGYLYWGQSTGRVIA